MIPNLNEKQQQEYHRCQRMGEDARLRGDTADDCPFTEGGHSIPVNEPNEPKRFIQTVPYMRAGWMDGFSQ